MGDPHARPSTASPDPSPSTAVVLLRFSLLSWLLTLAVNLCYFSEVHWLGVSTVVFVVAVWLEYSTLYLLIGVVPSFLIAGLARIPVVGASLRRARVPVRALALGLALLLTTAVLLLLVVDTIVFRMYGFHLNGFVWNLIRTPGGIASMDSGASTDFTAVAVIAGLLVVGACFLLLALRAQGLWRRLAPARPRFVGWIAVGAFLLVAGGERIAFAFSNLQEFKPIVAAHDLFPLYMRTRIRKLADALGLARRHGAPEISAETLNLSYPLAPLTLAAERRRWNIVFLVAESWRADTLDAEVMPATLAFAQQALWFRNHYSAGNGTRTGVFGLFYGLYGSYWFPFLSETRGPVLVDRIVEDDYQTFLATSARFSFPEFDKTVWARIPRAELKEGETTLRGWENDRKLVGEMLESIDRRDPARPFFTFLFFESPHAQYWFPDESVIRRPYSDEMNYATLGKEDMPQVKNRYLNAVHHLDSQFARIFRHLEEERLLDSTIVVVTGDHGEEFMEKGRFGHHSDFSEEQTRTPLVLWIPGEKPRAVTDLTSHIDVVATLLPRLGVTNPPDDYSLGFDLLGPVKRDQVVIADWDHLCVVSPDGKGIFPVNQRGFFGFDVTTLDDQPVADGDRWLAASRERLLGVVHALARFSR